MAGELTLCDLSDEVLQLIAASLNLEQLCCLGRVNKRLQKLVNEQEQLWKGLHLEYFGAPACSSTRGSPTNWKEAFKERYWQAVLDEAADETIGDELTSWEEAMADWDLEQEDEYAEASRIRRRKRKLRIMEARSHMQALERESQEQQVHLHAQLDRLRALEAERARLDSARRAGAALMCWQPSVVKNHHERFLAQNPVTAEDRCRELDMSIKDHRLALEVIRASSDARAARIEQQRKALQRLTPRPAASPCDH